MTTLSSECNLFDVVEAFFGRLADIMKRILDHSIRKLAGPLSMRLHCDLSPLRRLEFPNEKIVLKLSTKPLHHRFAEEPQLCLPRLPAEGELFEELWLTVEFQRAAPAGSHDMPVQGLWRRRPHAIRSGKWRQAAIATEHDLTPFAVASFGTVLNARIVDFVQPAFADVSTELRMETLEANREGNLVE